MRKIKYIMLILCICILFTGCGNSSTKEEGTSKQQADTKQEEKQKFTQEVYYEKYHVKFKLPENAKSGYFDDLGKKCQIAFYTNQSSVAALYPYDDKVDKVNHVTINGFNYDTYKYVENTRITYIYRTKVNNDYFLFQYYVFDKEYDDSQVEAFMNTVEYVYDSINSKQ